MSSIVDPYQIIKDWERERKRKQKKKNKYKEEITPVA